MKLSIRQRLLAVALLSAITCAVSLGALVRLMSLTSEQRLERARDALASELGALASGRAGAELPSYVGMRAGLVAAPPVPLDELALPPEVASALELTAETAAHSGATAIATIEQNDGMIIVGAGPGPSGNLAWSVYPVRAPRYRGTWRFIVISLAAATFLLVATALSAVTSVRRGADSLRRSLAALAKDLGAPIARPPERELGEVADGIAGLAHDLAAAQREKERLGRELALRDRLASLGRVAAGVAHEVRNPLASIKLRLDLAGSDPELAPRLATELSGVSAEIDRLDRLVADLLVVAGRRVASCSSIALGPLALARAELLGPWAETRGVTIRVKGDAESWLDPDGVARAVDNLIKNAVEASPKDGTVDVEIESGASGAILRVLDRGAGVAAPREPELFEPFFTTKADGTGLGLALSRAIASAHDGALDYRREDGVTCFELSFPRRAPAGAEARA